MIDSKEFIANFTDVKCHNDCTLKCGTYIYRGGKFMFKVKKKSSFLNPEYFEWINGRVKAISSNYKKDNMIAVLRDGSIGMTIFDSDIVDVTELY